MKVIRLGFIALLFCLASNTAFAWHEAGHMITALIAYDQLDTQTRQGIANILRHHPRFTKDFPVPDGLSKEDEERWLFCQASIWPDLVRRQGDGNIPANPSVKTSYHRAHWHFINFPFVLLPKGATQAERTALEASARQRLNLETSVPSQEILRMNVLQAIEFNATILQDANNKAEDRAVATCWLMHTVGDIHQPLHATALFTQNIFEPSNAHPEGDRGGNRVSFGSGKSDNLHSLWDDAPGSKHTFSIVLARAETLIEDTDLKTKGEVAAQKMDSAEWAKESFDFAKAAVYTKQIKKQILVADSQGTDPDTEQIVDLPDTYRDAAAKLAAQRVVEGGFRLGAKLRASLPP